MINIFNLDEIIRDALKEDIGSGDITTLAAVDEGRQIQGSFFLKEDGVICGLPIVTRIFEILDNTVKIKYIAAEGDSVYNGDVIAEISGPARSILSGERVALNFLQHLSGIATVTRSAVKRISGTKAVITDTRKTTPGLRSMEKYAVRVGGGANHRFNLADGILIKDNHITAAGGVSRAVKNVRKRASHMLKIEVEVETFAQIEEVLESRADIIMLDNMSIEDMRKAVSVIKGKALVEASGNADKKDLRKIAETGVDFISIGALTHTVAALDISLRFI